MNYSQQLFLWAIINLEFLFRYLKLNDSNNWKFLLEIELELLPHGLTSNIMLPNYCHDHW